MAKKNKYGKTAATCYFIATACTYGGFPGGGLVFAGAGLAFDLFS